MDRLPRSRLVLLPGSGHRPDIREPERVNPLLAEFLSADDAGGG